MPIEENMGIKVVPKKEVLYFVLKSSLCTAQYCLHYY